MRASSIARLWRPLAGYTVIAALVLSAAIALPPAPFARFFGPVPHLPVLAAAALVGAMALAALTAQDWTLPRAAASRFRGPLAAMAMAAPCAGAAIAIDLAAPFPRDMNVPSPQGLLFYPAIGFLVEVVFHVVPVALVWSAGSALLRPAARDKLVWPCVVGVAVLEPLFQTANATEGAPMWVPVAVGLNVFVINVVQLAVFRRYGFAAMLAVRLVYYLLWHVVWGALRLAVMF